VTLLVLAGVLPPAAVLVRVMQVPEAPVSVVPVPVMLVLLVPAVALLPVVQTSVALSARWWRVGCRAWNACCAAGAAAGPVASRGTAA